MSVCACRRPCEPIPFSITTPAQRYEYYRFQFVYSPPPPHRSACIGCTHTRKIKTPAARCCDALTPAHTRTRWTIGTSSERACSSLAAVLQYLLSSAAALLSILHVVYRSSTSPWQIRRPHTGTFVRVKSSLQEYVHPTRPSSCCGKRIVSLLYIKSNTFALPSSPAATSTDGDANISRTAAAFAFSSYSSSPVSTACTSNRPLPAPDRSRLPITSIE